MINKFHKSIALIVFFVGISSAQNKDDQTLGTQEVLVVKSYSPSLSDAFKIKSAPQLPDSLSSTEKELAYKIQEVPVVSTFQPNKASPLKLQQRSSYTPYNTLFSGAFGNKNQLLFNVSSVIELDRTQRFGLHFFRDGFGSNLENTLLKSNQNHSRFGLHHNLRSTEYNANTQLQFLSNTNNYFGLYDTNWDGILLAAINPEIRRSFFKLRTHWNWYDFLLRSISFQANLNADNFNTTEQQLALQAILELEMGEGKIKMEADAIGFNTRFENSFFDRSIEEYTQGLAELRVYWQHIRNDLKVKIGAGGSYVLGTDQIATNLLYYPHLEVSYQKAGNVISPYLKAAGGVELNTYKSLSTINPYLAPSTPLIPAFNQYNASLGIRSRLASVLNFDLGVLFDQVENFSYFERLPFDGRNEEDGYRLSNSYQNQYVNTDLYGFKAGIRIDISKNNFVRFETLYRYFETTNDQPLWNIPALKMNWESQFKWDDRFVLSLNGSLWGDRKAALRPIFLERDITNVQITLENLPLFITTSAHLTFKISDQFDAFVKGKFNSQGTHGRWAYFREAPMLLLGGITYKFDFQY